MANTRKHMKAMQAWRVSMGHDIRYCTTEHGWMNVVNLRLFELANTGGITEVAARVAGVTIVWAPLGYDSQCAMFVRGDVPTENLDIALAALRMRTANCVVFVRVRGAAEKALKRVRVDVEPIIYKNMISTRLAYFLWYMEKQHDIHL